MLNLFESIGIISIILIILLLVFLPLILTVIVGIGFANLLGFSGIFWWAFVILFYILIAGIIGLIGK